MKKQFFALALIVSICSTALAQNRNVGINTISPRATLEIAGSPETASQLDGIMIPKLTGSQLRAKTYTNAETSSMVFVTEADPAPAGQTIDVFAKGFYFFDGTDGVNKWVKVNAADIRVVGNRNHISSDAGNNNNGSGVGTGQRNIGIGNDALTFNTSGSNNVGIGPYALNNNTTGIQNMGIGGNALTSNVSGSDNTAAGVSASLLNFSGSRNSAFGAAALAFNGPGSNNTGVGYSSGYSAKGSNNLFLGANTSTQSPALQGSNNIIIGYDIDAASDSASNQLTLGNLIYGTGINGVRKGVSTGNIGIAVATPTSKFQVAGSISFPIRTFSGAVAATDHTVLGSGDVTIPTPIGVTGRIYNFIYDGTAYTVTGLLKLNGTNLASYSLNDTTGGFKITVQSNGTRWVIIDRN